MTQEQKQIIINGINNNESIASLARKLSIGESTIRMFIKRNIDKTDDTLCKNCGKAISSLPHHQTKVFCSDKCRMAWWNKNQVNVNKKAFYTFVCPCCNKETTVYGNKNQKYCSHACYIKARFGGDANEL